MEGWTDDADGDALAHTVRLTDADRQIELRAVTTTSPTYEIRHASCRVLGGDVASVGAGIASLCGARMIAGFTRRVAEAVGNGAQAPPSSSMRRSRLLAWRARWPSSRAIRRSGRPVATRSTVGSSTPRGGSTCRTRASLTARPGARSSAHGRSRRRCSPTSTAHAGRSEEHTSELQSQSNLVCRLLLEKKKKYKSRQVI